MMTKLLLSKPMVILSKPFRRLLTNWPWPVTFRKHVAGRILHVDLRTSIGREILLTGAFDPIVFQPLAQRLRPGDTFVDVGINIGYYSLLALEKVGPTGQVHGFDIDPRPLGLIRKTIKENNLQNLHLHAVAVGDRVGQGVLVKMSDSGHSYMTSNAAGSLMPMTTLDALYEAGELPPARAIKIDIEGGEYGVLKGARRYILESRPMIVFEAQNKFLARNEADLDDVFRFLQTCGYTWKMLAGAGSPTVVAQYANEQM